MSSSYHLAKRLESGAFQNIPGDSGIFGDTYIRPVGNCHPDFIAHPFGPWAEKYPLDAPKICVRKPPHPVTRSEFIHKKDIPSSGIHDRERVRLYGSSRISGENNRIRIDNRGIDEKISRERVNDEVRDYAHWEVPYNGLGFPNKIKSSRTNGNAHYLY